jgi:hypothetical protein
VSPETLAAVIGGVAGGAVGGVLDIVGVAVGLFGERWVRRWGDVRCVIEDDDWYVARGIVDWESSNDPKVNQIQEQTQQKPLPIYVKRPPYEWEYMGRFRVTHVATDARTLAERRRIVGRTISYAIYLEKS